MTQFGQLNYSTLGLYLVATIGEKGCYYHLDSETEKMI
jgi:hypothetical protein